MDDRYGFTPAPSSPSSKNLEVDDVLTGETIVGTCPGCGLPTKLNESVFGHSVGGKLAWHDLCWQVETEATNRFIRERTEGG